MEGVAELWICYALRVEENHGLTSQDGEKV
jgi:hypothetical protein